jgi:hypothetical protein
MALSERFLRPYVETRNNKFKMAAAKPDVAVSQLLYKKIYRYIRFWQEPS